ncbi:MAG: dethiobiotin synthase [Candidatus Brocadia sp. AMX2]|uniref:ATP-dependent dethiobiotin synthetase BioD n=1 Tax=Candidatus Brocadia sinica JPN1 TaxID=1197129 RepID=A0ABQ0JYH8_9BACT|nr:MULTISPECIES: dethiobiotin synthase [Brocadia]MBC6934116.1 dethiobiotin synthase [Candidatus Brocadia sp.]MBL1170703.1 dethiobiotin synthase [Candidatus Brocadia sp. AMX1]MCK6470026.1 dethiobiotin synthase [Candidatus Brocadia sinica]NOG40414.1 dethiobiotin synthase [Planctomycetota bacterium]KAA0241276.1 MAG: dethiobiotin synthase [Candidatus Brocadia sp. AMX2]
MGRGYFITGTDTGVGKTIVAGGLAALYKNKGLDVGVMKPVATGCKRVNNNLISDDAVFLKCAAEVDDEYELINPVSLEQPLAPTVAARLSKTKIDKDKINTAFDSLCERHEYIIVEGIGGLLVPLDEYYFVVDMANEMELPLIVVCRPTLGTINHTLLTVSYARQHGLDVKGIVINESVENRDDVMKKTNAEEIKRLTDLPILGTISFDKRLDINKYNKEILVKIFSDKIDKDIII